MLKPSLTLFLEGGSFLFLNIYVYIYICCPSNFQIDGFFSKLIAIIYAYMYVLMLLNATCSIFIVLLVCMLIFPLC